MSPRAKFISTVTLKRLAGYAWDAMTLASTHDPDHAKELKELRDRVTVLEHQLEMIGAPLYRRQGNLVIQRVRDLPTPTHELREVQ